MVKAKLIFLVIMTVLAVVIFVTPMFFPENKSNNKDGRRTRMIVRIRMACFLIILVLFSFLLTDEGQSDIILS